MNKILGALLVLFLFHSSVHAVDRVRIAYPSAVGHFITLPLPEKKGFLREKGIDAEIVRIATGAARVPALVSGEVDYFTGVGPLSPQQSRKFPSGSWPPTCLRFR
jgi:ABC-type nitrate/sulfonate/bicarbonate transport system substrate-binding protein